MDSELKLLYELPADSRTVYLKIHGKRCQIFHFLRMNGVGVKKKHAGGEIYSGDIAVIKLGERKVEVVLTTASIITEFSVDPTPKQKPHLHHRA